MQETEPHVPRRMQAHAINKHATLSKLPSNSLTFNFEHNKNN
jgi:hypothetical protein